MSDIDNLEALAKAATPGPWHECPMSMFVFGPRGGDMIASTDDNGELLIRGFGARLPMEANAHYIAAANPSVILDLIRRVREAERERDEARKDVALAAGELLVPIPAPGTDESRMLLANVAMRRERDAARVDGRMLEEAARRLGVDVDGLKPAHVFRAIDKAIAERDAALAALEAMRVERGSRPAITPEDADLVTSATSGLWFDGDKAQWDAFERVKAALREHGKGGR